MDYSCAVRTVESCYAAITTAILYASTYTTEDIIPPENPHNSTPSSFQHILVHHDQLMSPQLACLSTTSNTSPHYSPIPKSPWVTLDWWEIPPAASQTIRGNCASSGRPRAPAKITMTGGNCSPRFPRGVYPNSSPDYLDCYDVIDRMYLGYIQIDLPRRFIYNRRSMSVYFHWDWSKSKRQKRLSLQNASSPLNPLPHRRFRRLRPQISPHPRRTNHPCVQHSTSTRHWSSISQVSRPRDSYYSALEERTGRCVQWLPLGLEAGESWWSVIVEAGGDLCDREEVGFDLLG